MVSKAAEMIPEEKLWKVSMIDGCMTDLLAA
jgi:hypothetical protein